MYSQIMNELEIPKIAMKFLRNHSEIKITSENFFPSHLSFFSVPRNIFPFHYKKIYTCTNSRTKVMSVGIKMKTKTAGGEALTQRGQRKNVPGSWLPSATIQTGGSSLWGHVWLFGLKCIKPHTNFCWCYYRQWWQGRTSSTPVHVPREEKATGRVGRGLSP